MVYGRLDTSNEIVKTGLVSSPDFIGTAPPVSSAYNKSIISDLMYFRTSFQKKEGKKRRVPKDTLL
jgi:hypothetical protein